MNINSSTYRNTMFLPLPLRVHHQPYPYPHPHRHQSPLFNGFYRPSYYPRVKPYSYNDVQLLERQSFLDRRFRIKGRSFSSSLSIPTYKMQQEAINESTIGVPSPLCSVCGDISTGIHFGGNSCESCKAFFRRSVQCLRFQNYKCSSEERCPVNIVTRKVCQFCRYAKCVAIGMRPKWVLSDQEREEKYGSRRKRFRENRAPDEDPDIYKYLTKEEKLLIEDIAHAFYQSRATYPLTFPNPQALFATAINTTSENASAPSPSGEKPPNAPANLLIVPIQRLVLFARMLKDFDGFSEDDKVNLLKGSAIEIMVCSSNTLFNPKTQTFTNYLSRDQRAVMDDQVLSLDPLLMKLWGEEVFFKTRNFLISMCNLHIDEVTSTLLVPVILFSPDRSNVQNLDLIKRLQEKYATILRKYMNWRYGIQLTDILYPKLLLQIVNIRALSLAHGEIIQKMMASSSVNPLVQEVVIKPEMLNRPTIERTDSFSFSSSPPPDIEMLDFDKTPFHDSESNLGSDEDDLTKKKQRPSTDDDIDFDLDDLLDNNPRNIWRKRRKYNDPSEMSTNMQTELTGIDQNNLNNNNNNNNNNNKTNNQMKTTNDYKNLDKYPQTNCLYMRPHDHQVPTLLPVQHGDLMTMSASGYSIPNQFSQMPLNSPSLVTSPQSVEQLQQLYRAHSTASDLSSYDYDSAQNSVHSSILTSPSGHYYDEQTYDNYRQHYAQISSSSFQQQQNEQQLLLLSLANNQSQTPPIQSMSSPLTDSQSQTATTLDPTSLLTRSTLDDDEQQLLNAIHAHPNKRDLVLNLLRQMNQPPSSNYPQQQQQQQQQDRSDS